MNIRIRGTVIPGAKMGHKIGFPTANIALEDTSGVPFGVYAVVAEIEGRQYPGVANLGVKPTVSQQRVPLLEVHLFGLSADIYGQEISVSLLHFIRAERKFSSVEELRRQISLDKRAAEDYFDSL